MKLQSHPRGAAQARIAAWITAALILVVFIGGAAAPASAQTSTANPLAQYRAWMVEAKQMYPYPQSVDKMYRVMFCESSGRPNVVGPQGLYHGLFQYHRGTWGGSWNPYRAQNIYDARSQIFATAKAWSIGMQSHWSCYYITAGR